MTEKRYVLYNRKDTDYILDNPKTHLDFLEMLGDALTSEEIVDRLNEQEQRIEALESGFIKDLESMHNDCMKCEKEYEERIKELEDKLNQTALFFLNYNMISMGKAVEISEMSYHDFLKYRKENGNPMELQL